MLGQAVLPDPSVRLVRKEHKARKGHKDQWDRKAPRAKREKPALLGPRGHWDHRVRRVRPGSKDLLDRQVREANQDRKGQRDHRGQLGLRELKVIPVRRQLRTLSPGQDR